MDDYELWRAWSDGDRGAADELADRHYVAVFRFFQVKVGEPAQDLSQKTFLAFLEAFPRYERVGSVRAFLFGIARKQLMRHFEGREHRGREKVNLSVVTAHDMLPSPSQVIADRERRDTLLAAMRRVPVDDQIVLELYYWNEMSISEICQVLDAPAGTIKSKLSRARSRLRSTLEELAPEARLDDEQLAERTRRAGTPE